MYRENLSSIQMHTDIGRICRAFYPSKQALLCALPLAYGCACVQPAGCTCNWSHWKGSAWMCNSGGLWRVESLGGVRLALGGGR